MTKRVFTPEQKARQAENQRRRRKENPAKYRMISRTCERRRKLRKYGLTEQEYQQLLIDQAYRCAICLQLKEQIRDWHVDHCHESGKVRGILCHHCNLMLGNARDNILILQSGIKYLERHH